MVTTLSMHQYAVRQLGDGDIAKGLEVFDAYAMPIEEWLINQSTLQKKREAAAIFIFVISAGMALIGSHLSSALTAPSALTTIVAAAAYCWIKLELQRLVARKDDIKSLPQPFRDAYNGKLGAVTKEAFGNGVTVLDARGNMTSLRRDICALDVIWFIESGASTKLKIALQSDQNRFPTNILLSVAGPDIQLDYANVAIDDVKLGDEIAAPTYDANELPEFEKHWLAIHDHRKTLARLEAFKEHLPLELKWMVLPMEKAFHRCKLEPYIDDKQLFDIVWRNLVDDAGWKNDKSVKDKDTVRRLIYRDRASGYHWVREYFSDLSRTHKYAPEDQSPKKQPFLPFG
jgi:hypothetical protein